MKIAQVSPLYESVPPRLYGGTERVVAALSDALVDLGHEVTLFASGDSRTRARLFVGREKALRLDPTPLKSDLASHLNQLAELRKQAHRFDMIHFHTDMIHFPFFEEIVDKTVTTLHARLDISDLPPIYHHFPRYPLVSISGSQRRPLALANWIATVHNGISAELLRPPAAPKGDYLAFLGRISPEKRVDRAIAIATAAGIPLRIAAKVDDVDKSYFHHCIEPLLRQPGVEFIGEIGDAEKSDFLGHAAALLFPIDWPEPFGMVMIESLACGTPVIAWGNGSVFEIVDPEVTGFIVNSLESAISAVSRVHRLSRQTAREVFERRFSAKTMARAYLDVYERLISKTPRSMSAA